MGVAISYESISAADYFRVDFSPNLRLCQSLEHGDRGVGWALDITVALGATGIGIWTHTNPRKRHVRMDSPSLDTFPVHSEQHTNCE